MRATVIPVDENDTEFLTHPPRPLFPNIHEPFGRGQVPSPDTELIEESVGVFDDMVFNDGAETGAVLVEE